MCLSERFLGFAQFRPLDQIRALLKSTPELKDLPVHVTDLLNPLVVAPLSSDSDAQNKYLRDFFGELTKMQGEDVERAVRAYTARVQREGVAAYKEAEGLLGKRELENLVEAVSNCADNYPGDGAVFVTTSVLPPSSAAQSDEAGC